MSQYRNIDVTGSLSLHDTTFGKEGSSCAGNGGYSDISSSAQVTVSDGAGKILAVSDLSDGVVDGSNNCSFAFTVKNLPYSDVYQFEVSHRGKLVYSHQQLVDKQYMVAMTLGE